MQLSTGDRNLIVSGLGRLLADPEDVLVNPPGLRAEINALRDRVTMGEGGKYGLVTVSDGVSDIDTATEDELESGSPEYALMSLRLRLESWLREQPDVTGLQDCSVDGTSIYGFSLANTNGISLTVGLTQ